MTEFTDCPGGCDAKVKVGDGDMVSFCCHNCWRWYWDGGVMNKAPYDNYGAFLPRHSERCLTRQMSRVHEPVVTDRQFSIKTKDSQ